MKKYKLKVIRGKKMSEWYEAEAEDLSISDDGEELHILFDSDEFGNKYVSVKIQDIVDLLLLDMCKE